MDFALLDNQLDKFGSFVSAKEALYNDRKKRIEALEKELASLLLDKDLSGKAEEVLLYISKKLLGQSITNIDKLITLGLRLVFDDQTLEFRSTVEKYRGKTAIKFHLYDKGQESPLTSSFGGGVLVVIGVLLRVLVIITLQMKRVLLLDESLSHLSEDYVPNASKLLKKICKDLEFKILMVTHSDSMATSSDAHYKAKRKGGSVVFEKQGAS